MSFLMCDNRGQKKQDKEKIFISILHYTDLLNVGKLNEATLIVSLPF